MIVRILFESLWLLVGVWAGAQLVIVGVWSWRRTPRSARNVWFGLAALPVLILLSVQVVTLRERIVLLCLEMADNVENGNVTGIERRLSDDFEAQGLDRTAFAARLDETLTRHRVKEVTLRRFVVTVAKRNLVVVELHATCLLRSPDLPYERFVSDWRLHFALCGIRWKLRSIERLPASSRLMDRFAKSRGG